MYVPGFIARRVAFSRQHSFSGFITRLSIIATALSVATMIVALAIIYGFQGAVSQKVFSFWGHIRVKAYETSRASIAEENFITRNDTIEQQLRQTPNVVAVNPFATKSAIISNKKEFDGLLMKGVEKDYQNEAFKTFLTEGRWLHFPDSGFSKEVLVSVTVAKLLGVKTGDKLFLYFMNNEEGKTRAKDVTVAGLFRTDIEEYDKNFFIGDLNLIRDLNNWEKDQIGGYEIILQDYKRTNITNQAINDAIGMRWQSRTMQQESAHIFDWLGLLDTNKYILLGVMALVAAINLITCLIILVLERIRMTGVLKALGAASGDIQQIFIWHTLFIAITGIVSGAILGVGLCLLQQYTGFIHLPNAEAYSVSTVPVEILWWHVPMVCIGTLAICGIILIIPALIIKRVNPVKAIQFR